MNGQGLSLGEAASRFLAKLPPEEKRASQQEVYRFVRWFGWERSLAGLKAPEVANYAEQLSLSDTDYLKKLELIRAFLVYAKKEGWTNTSLATHLKTRKGKAPPLSLRRGSPAVTSLTRQGYAELEAELAMLKAKRSQAIDEMRKAAADKDFRENAPLAAAREQHGQIEGRIRELEGILKSATVIDEVERVTPKASLGDSVILQDLASGEEVRYTLVSPREVNPAEGKVSTLSPIGRAIIGQSEGEVIEVTVPAGKLRYQIKRIVR